MYEVELKFPLNDSRDVIALLTELGSQFATPIEQVDRYFNHPARDFRQTDEAFRIRSVGSSNCLTYKGPILDRSTKTRREIEIDFADSSHSATQMAEMWLQLGFRHVRDVRKIRTPGSLEWNNRRYELALDTVPPIGTFLEIELVVQDADRDAARDAILKLADKLNLHQPERRSYLELLVQADQTRQPERP
jgi:adenylate cyclase class 2